MLFKGLYLTSQDTLRLTATTMSVYPEPELKGSRDGEGKYSEKNFKKHKEILVAELRDAHSPAECREIAE